MRNIFNESKEAWHRIREYIAYVRMYPKSDRDELSETILRSYRDVLFNWFFGLLGLIILNGFLGLIIKGFINSLLYV